MCREQAVNPRDVPDSQKTSQSCTEEASPCMDRNCTPGTQGLGVEGFEGFGVLGFRV